MARDKRHRSGKHLPSARIPKTNLLNPIPNVRCRDFRRRIVNPGSFTWNNQANRTVTQRNPDGNRTAPVPHRPITSHGHRRTSQPPISHFPFPIPPKCILATLQIDSTLRTDRQPSPNSGRKPAGRQQQATSSTSAHYHSHSALSQMDK